MKNQKVPTSCLAYLVFTIYILASLTVMGQNTVPHQINTKEKVGWIPFDPLQDDSGFEVCDEYNIQEYYQVNPKYLEGSKSIKAYFKTANTNYRIPSSFSGFLTVRFVINCQGSIDRVRFKTVDQSYQSVEIKIDTETVKKSLKNMGKWTPGAVDGVTYDCYKHIVFKVTNGEISDIIG
ncbi:MAG: hypothetical protein AAGA66_06975 [Bacteroidota bacterium]